MRLAEIADRKIKPPPDLTIHVLGKTDHAGLADAFQSRGDIDAVAHTFFDDIAEWMPIRNSMSRLKPTTSAARLAASVRVSLIAPTLVGLEVGIKQDGSSCLEITGFVTSCVAPPLGRLPRERFSPWVVSHRSSPQLE